MAETRHGGTRAKLTTNCEEDIDERSWSVTGAMRDVTVVGGGVLGTMHAWFALRRGHRVVQIERDAEARSASVRNFGLVWVSGRSDGVELTLALRARELWEDIGRRVPGLGFRPDGSLTVALGDVELSVMAEYANSVRAKERDTVLLEPDEVRAVNPALRGTIAGALHCRRDAIVESRVAQPALRAAMVATGRYQFVNDRHVVSRDTTSVIDHRGDRYEADVLVICPGAVHDGLAGEHLSTAPVRRCQLQMMQTAPLDDALTTSIADIDSLRYYPAYEELELDRLGAQEPVAASHRMQLLLVQRLDGGLTIGDTHVYDEPFPFDVHEDPYTHLLARAEAILGRPVPPVERRWSGVYSQLAPDAPDHAVYHHVELEPGVVVVTGPGGRGMTLAPSIAEQTWEHLT